MLRTVIYVDGQNLRYALEPFGLQEKDVHWGRLFEYLTPTGHRLIRANWYQAERIGHWEWNAKFHSRWASNAGIPADEFQSRATAYYESERRRLDQLHHAVYGRIEENFDAIEFRYAGVLKVEPTRVWKDNDGNLRIGKRIGEKGVDVALAVDMVRQAQDYDHAILVSGDFDYVPAIQAVKDMLRRVTVVSLMKGTPPQRQGQARRLRGLCDAEVHIYEEDLKTRFRFPAVATLAPTTPAPTGS